MCSFIFLKYGDTCDIAAVRSRHLIDALIFLLPLIWIRFVGQKKSVDNYAAKIKPSFLCLNTGHVQDPDAVKGFNMEILFKKVGIPWPGMKYRYR